MAWYRRGKLTADALRSLVSKFNPRTPITQSDSRICQTGYLLSATNKAKGSGFSSYSSISQRFGLQGNANRNLSSLFNGGAKRFYYVDRYNVRHFRPRGPQRWFQNPRIVLVVVIVGSGILITVYFGNTETIPYTKRTHFVLLSKDMERKLGESQFKQMKAEFKGKILPSIHPDSIRVRMISQDIINGLQRGLRKEQVWSDLGYASELDFPLPQEAHGHGTLMAWTESEKLEGKWSREDEILDDKWVQKCRKKARERGSEPATSHLEALNWEVLVVNEPIVNAMCMPGGKIVVFTGLLDHFKTDAEIATIIGHEVGHAVARHSAEGMTKNLWFAILNLILYQFVTPDIVNTMSALLLRLPFSRRMEMEADYIGLLLMASAGYDPRVAPSVYQKLDKVAGDSSTAIIRDYLSTHPSGKKRAQLLAQAHVMEEAVSIYREVNAGRGVQGFL